MKKIILIALCLLTIIAWAQPKKKVQERDLDKKVQLKIQDYDSVHVSSDSISWYSGGNVLSISPNTLSADDVTVTFDANNKLGQVIYKDTTTLKSKSADSTGTVVYLKQLSSTNTAGGGWFVQIDSAYGEGIANGNIAFDCATQGKQWVREGLSNKRSFYAIDYGVVPNDSTFSATNTTIINALCSLAFNSLPAPYILRVGEIVLPSGTIWVSKKPGSKYCLDTKAGVWFRGQGNSPQDNGTKLKLRGQQATGGDTVVVVTNGTGAYWWDNNQTYQSAVWWHYSSIERIYIDCNSTGNAGYTVGLDIHRPGEAAAVTNVIVGTYYGWGVRVKDAAAPPLRMESISVFPGPVKTATDTTGDLSISPRKGFWFDQGGHITGTTLSGDGNRPLIYMGDGHVSDGAGKAIKVFINGLKYESGGWTAGSGHQSALPVVFIDSVTAIGGDVHITQFFANRGATSTMKEDAIHIRGGAGHHPGVKVWFSQATGFDNLLYYTVTGVGTDSVHRIDSPSLGQAEQRSSQIEWGHRLKYTNISKIMEYPATGFLYKNNLDTLIKSLFVNTDQIFHITSPKSAITMETFDGTDLMTLTSSLNTSTVALTTATTLTNTGLVTMNGGLKLGGSGVSRIDSMKYKSSGDSLQIFINGTGWKAFKLTNSGGN